MRILLDQRILAKDGIGRFSFNLVNKLLNTKSSIDNEYFVISRQKKDDVHYYYDCSNRYTWQELENLGKAIDFFNVDLIHCFDFKVPYPAVDIPVIVSIHDIFRYTDPSQCYDDNFFIYKYGINCYRDICDIVDCLSEESLCYGIEKQSNECSFIHYEYYKLLLIWSIVTSSKIIVPSNFVKDEILRCFYVNSDKIVVIPYGVDHYGIRQTDLELTNFLNRKSKFIYVGQNRKHKNVQTILEAMSIFINKHPEFYLELIGADFKESQRQFIDKYNLGNNLKLLGYVSDDTIRKKYSDSKALIHISSYEGYGFTPLEAMCYGCPVITGKTCIAQEVLGKYPIYVEQINNVEQLLQAMETVVSREMLFCKEAQKFALNHTWDKFVRIVLQVYADTL